MNAVKETSCLEIVNCLVEDQQILASRIRSLRAQASEQRRAALDELASLLAAYCRAEEEVVLARAFEIENLRVIAMAALEEHELAELLIDRAKHSAHEEQLDARLRVLCDLVERHLEKNERDLFPRLRAQLSAEEREEMGMRYRETKSRNELAPVFQMPMRETLLGNQTGRVGYIIAWLLGVPVWVLLLIFLIRGH